MKKTLFITIAMLVSSSVFAATDHYVLRDDGHVYHLKITDINNEVTVSVDVDFEPAANDKGKKACSSHLSGEAKRIDKNTLLVKKHSEIDSSFCEVKLHVTDTGVKIERSKDCDNFATGACHFSSDGKEIVKVK